MFKLFRTQILVSLAINAALFLFGFWIIGGIVSFALIVYFRALSNELAIQRLNPQTAHLFQHLK